MIPLGFALSSCAGASDQELGEEVAAEVMEAFQAENFTRVLELTDGIEEASSWRQIRATAFQRRGEARFFEANIAGCIADFDAFLKMYPEQDPYHWQRGLAYYYAKEYEEGKAQFERHQDVNSQDVENAVWHFICSVRAPGGSLEEARDGFIPIQLDSRVPMKEVHALFAGDGSVDDVLNAAAADEDSVVSEQERNHLCYAHLYLALYFEALGEEEKMKDHIRLAAFDYAMDHYMGKTAQVHAKIRGVDPKPQGPSE